MRGLCFPHSQRRNVQVDTTLLLSAAMKFADSIHATKPFHIHELWVDRVTREPRKRGEVELPRLFSRSRPSLSADDVTDQIDFFR